MWPCNGTFRICAYVLGASGASGNCFKTMRHLIAGYIAKYVGKDISGAGFNKKRYWSSKGVVLPETTTYAHLGAESSAGDAVAAAYRCVDENGADFNSAQLFWNRGIGVFWMATGNTD